jgi:hypothetical protein
MKNLLELNDDFTFSRSINYDFILKYQNDDIIEKFQSEHHYHDNSASVLFTELKKYLFICANNPKSYPPSKSIDDIWHTFILFTHEYTSFCHKAFGKYIHHAPNVGYTGQRLQIEPFSQTIAELKRTFKLYNEHFWEHKAGGDGDEDDWNGCTHNDCGPVTDDIHDSLMTEKKG